jgi:hypothetical protein
MTTAAFNWVERAEDYDDSIDEANRMAAAERQLKLLENRSRFKLEEQQRCEDRVRSTDSALNRMAAAPLTEVTQVTIDTVTGKKTITKVKVLNGRDMAALMKARNDAALLAQGVSDPTDIEKEERKVERIVWAEDKRVKPAKQRYPESGRGNRQPIAASDPTQTDLEVDEAA